MRIHPDAAVDSWGTVITDPKEEYWRASRPTNNTGELSAIYRALKCILAFRSPGSRDRRNFGLLSDSENIESVVLPTTRSKMAATRNLSVGYGVVLLLSSVRKLIQLHR